MNALTAAAGTVLDHGLLPHLALLAVGLAAITVAIRDTTPAGASGQGSDDTGVGAGPVWSRRNGRTWPGFVAAYALVLAGLLVAVAVLVS